VPKKVSIILPTYNRADTIVRAIKSVQSQTFQDWELIVVDDGSTDNTVALIHDLEPRMILIRQENRGFTEARNVGIRSSRGEYLAFLDSDDEFMPYHLELCVAFLDAHPKEQFVATELLENMGAGRFTHHYRIETAEWYPEIAAAIGSHMLDLPPGETDNYLRVYTSREPIGDWGGEIVNRVGAGKDACLYRGQIFEYLRWGFLITITATMMRRAALEKVGLPQTRFKTGSDFHFMATLCRTFGTSYLSIPTFIKHELATEGQSLAFGHVVTGRTALTFARDMCRTWDELFWEYRRDDRELLALRGIRLFHLAEIALEFGERDEALKSLQEARQSMPHFWKAIALEGLVKCLPGPELARNSWLALTRGSAASSQLLHGQLPFRVFLQKGWSRLRNRGSGAKTNGAELR
jgi:glycosyltransferase involved in cell wall biosynthesis